MIEEEIKQELKDSLTTHGLQVENLYLSSLTPIEGSPVEQAPVQAEMPKTAEEIMSNRVISGNINQQG